MPFGDIPLFREIQKLLSAGGGPVNLEIARQVANSVSVQGPTFRPAPDDPRHFAEAVRRTEMLVAGFTRLQLDEPLGTTVMTRSDWAGKTLEAWGWLFSHQAGRFSQELSKLGGEQGAEGMQAALAQIGPLLMGLQVGTLVGQLSLDALARYDLPIPRDDDGTLFAVTPNVERICDDYDLDRADFYRWLAVHEISHHIVALTTPWLDRYHRSLLTEIVDSTEIDVGDLERRIIEMQSRGMDALQQEAGEQGMLPVVSTERHRKALDRLNALVAVRTGYADMASDAVGPSVIDDKSKVDEGMRRWRSAPSQGQALLASVAGITLDRSVEQTGRTFCNAIAELRGLPMLNRVWDAPDYLPSMEEIRDPFLWIERVEAG
jgi:putative hydrolase